MIFIFGAIGLFAIILIAINDQNRPKNTFLALIVLSILLSLSSQQSLLNSDSETIEFLTFFYLKRQALSNFQYLLYTISGASLIGFLYSDSKR